MIWETIAHRWRSQAFPGHIDYSSLQGYDTYASNLPPRRRDWECLHARQSHTTHRKSLQPFQYTSLAAYSPDINYSSPT